MRKTIILLFILAVTVFSATYTASSDNELADILSALPNGENDTVLVSLNTSHRISNRMDLESSSSLIIKAASRPSSLSEMPQVIFDHDAGFNPVTGFDLRHDNITFDGLHIRGDGTTAGHYLITNSLAVSNIKIHGCAFSRANTSTKIQPVRAAYGIDTLIIENCIFYDINTGFAIDASGSDQRSRVNWKVRNSTFFGCGIIDVNNTSTSERLDSLEIANCVASDTAVNGIPAIRVNGNVAAGSYILNGVVVHNFDTSTTHFTGKGENFWDTADPRFMSTDTANAGFLRPDSSAISPQTNLINSGTNSVVTEMSTDIFGSTRNYDPGAQFTKVDIGAIETQSTMESKDKTSPNALFSLDAEARDSTEWQIIDFTFTGTGAGGTLTDSADVDSLYIFWSNSKPYTSIPSKRLEETSEAYNINSATTSFTDSIIIDKTDKMYYFTSCLVDEAGNKTSFSNSVSDSTRTSHPVGVSVKPTFDEAQFAASVTAPTYSTMTVTWDTSGIYDEKDYADSLKVIRFKGKINQSPVREDSLVFALSDAVEVWNISGLTEKTDYSYQFILHYVAPDNSGWLLENSIFASGTTPKDPAPPQNNISISVSQRGRVNSQNLAVVNYDMSSWTGEEWQARLYGKTSPFTGKYDTLQSETLWLIADTSDTPCAYPEDPSRDTLFENTSLLPDGVYLALPEPEKTYYFYMALADTDTNWAEITSTCTTTVTTYSDTESPDPRALVIATPEASAVDSNTIPVTIQRNSVFPFDKDADSVKVYMSLGGYPDTSNFPFNLAQDSVLFATVVDSINIITGYTYTANTYNNNTQYYFLALYSDSAGNWCPPTQSSLYITQATKTGNDITPPNNKICAGGGAPSSLLSVSATDTKAITLHLCTTDWTQVTDSSDRSKLLIYYSDTNHLTSSQITNKDVLHNEWVQLNPIIPVDGTNILLDGLRSDKTYYISATVNDASGNISSEICEFTAATDRDTIPPDPAFLTMDIDTSADRETRKSEIVITWDKNILPSDADTLGIVIRPGTSYPVINDRTFPSETGDITAKIYTGEIISQKTLTGLSAGTNYSVILSVCDEAGNWAPVTDAQNSHLRKQFITPSDVTYEFPVDSLVIDICGTCTGINSAIVSYSFPVDFLDDATPWFIDSILIGAYSGTSGHPDDYQDVSVYTARSINRSQDTITITGLSASTDYKIFGYVRAVYGASFEPAWSNTDTTGFVSIRTSSEKPLPGEEFEITIGSDTATLTPGELGWTETALDSFSLSVGIDTASSTTVTNGDGTVLNIDVNSTSSSQAL